MAEKKLNYYPKQVIKNNQHPRMLFAFPFVGILIRLILTIPVNILIFIYSFWYAILWVAVPFVILFTGKYPESFYRFFLGYMRMYTKVAVYIAGLTDKYPGYGLDGNGIVELDFPKPHAPSRALGAPLIGFIVRIVLLIPFLIFESVLSYGAQWAVLFSWFGVLFKKRYPESLYEFVTDYLRVSNASTIYMTYLSDTYPSFEISMKHKRVKILLLVLGALGVLNNGMNNAANRSSNNYNNTYQDSSYDNASY
jgi:hypothetical protein